MVSKATLGPLLLACGVLAAGIPAVAGAAAPLEDLTEVGGGTLRWFGMEVYDARLLNSTGRIEGPGSQGPLALEITYHRSISRDRLLSTTEREWRRLEDKLGLDDPATTAAWLAELGGIWPDVAPGDRIVALVEPAGPTRFYGNDGVLGSVTDARFGPAFLAIWLHPATRAADLRQRLLGEDR